MNTQVTTAKDGDSLYRIGQEFVSLSALGWQLKKVDQTGDQILYIWEVPDEDPQSSELNILIQSISNEIVQLETNLDLNQPVEPEEQTTDSSFPELLLQSQKLSIINEILSDGE